MLRRAIETIVGFTVLAALLSISVLVIVVLVIAITPFAAWKMIYD